MVMNSSPISPEGHSPTREGRSFERWWVLVALTSVVLGAALRWLPDRLFGGSQAFITFYPVVAMAALLAGGRAGLLTTALSALVADFVFLEPLQTRVD